MHHNLLNNVFLRSQCIEGGWQEDLFAEGDEDNRFTVDGEAFVSAQRAWLDALMPRNGVLLEMDQYGREVLPPKAQPTWTKAKKDDKVGFSIRR